MGGMDIVHFSLAFCLLLVTACNTPSPALPTVAAVATVPIELQPTATSVLPPTLDLTAIAPTAAPTTVPTVRPTFTPTPVNPFVNITVPNVGMELLMGSSFEARGLIQIGGGQTIWLDLVSVNGRLLNTVPGTLGDIGWEATMTVPEFVSGAAVLRAIIRDESDNVVAQNEVGVSIIPDVENAERFLLLLRPQGDERAVAGFSMFFDGRVLLAADGLITISVWTEDCQTQVTRQSFRLGPTARPVYWQGFAIPPRDAAGEACAVAHFGEPGAADWREAVVPITVYPTDDPEAKGVIIGNPPPETTVVAGEELLLYGSAFNVSEGTIRLSIVLENGFILFDGEVATDFWGYWEQPVLLPVDIEGAAEITVFTEPEDPDDYAEAKTPIIIEPAPPP